MSPGQAEADAVVEGLAAVVGPENVLTAGERFEACCHDATEIRHPPLAVAVLSDAAQIPRVIDLARKHGTAIIARGAGTGLSGGAVAERGGVVLALEKLDRVISLDAEARVAVVEPGVITQALADRAAAHDLFYPPDPASVAESTLAGNVAECAGGLRCKKYGVTKDYVLGIEGYDGAGKLVQTGYFAKDQLYDLTSLIVGSEGTLLIISKIALCLIDPAAERRTFLAIFSRQEDAAEVVGQVLAMGVIPAVLEFMDGDVLSCCREYLSRQGELEDDDQLGVRTSADALLLIELDGAQPDIERDSGQIGEVIRKYDPLRFLDTSDAARREYLWKLRRSLSRAVTAAAPLRVSEDVCVPPSRLAELVAWLPALGREYALRVNSFGHAGDGNLHVNFLAAEDSDLGRLRITQAAESLFNRTLSLGGTISGEHGIGFCKREFLPLEVSPATMTIFRKIKAAFDPDGVINPGKIFD